MVCVTVIAFVVLSVLESTVNGCFKCAIEIHVLLYLLIKADSAAL